MKKLIKNQRYQVTIDTAFEKVIIQCSKPRKDQEGTWITAEMKAAYLRMHHLGYAHSIEAWDIHGDTNREPKLVGGLYGVSLGNCFFGESMFAHSANASKYAFIMLSHTLFKKGFQLIDCQVPTSHLKSLGAEEIPRIEFLALLHTGLDNETLSGKWQFPIAEI
jgi:leucyl/phenylalanyl-tRNA--protein transferase